jgi:hypothetical protein
VELQFFPPAAKDRRAAIEVGFRVGKLGTHNSRTMMLAELGGVLAEVAEDSKPERYVAAVVEENCLHKPTASTRQATLQRLRELYALDPKVPIFRVLRRLWTIGTEAQPQLALLVSLARDPLLLATAPSVLATPIGAELVRGALRDSLAREVGERLNDSTIDKVLRNAASSWKQSGHLEGRTFKHRRKVHARPESVALALYLAHAAGFALADCAGSAWVKVLDCDVSSAMQLAVEAKRLNLIDLRMSGSVVDLNVDRLDPAYSRR